MPLVTFTSGDEAENDMDNFNNECDEAFSIAIVQFFKH